jgi:hypothetical protein
VSGPNTTTALCSTRSPEQRNRLVTRATVRVPDHGGKGISVFGALDDLLGRGPAPPKRHDPEPEPAGRAPTVLPDRIAGKAQPDGHQTGAGGHCAGDAVRAVSVGPDHAGVTERSE